MSTFLKYLPFILQSIIAVQATLPTLKGESKKKVALDLIALGAGLTTGIPNEHAAEVGALIDGSVKILQAGGVFGKDQVPTATPATA